MNNRFETMSILYVEDDPIILEGALKYLNKLFKKVWGAKDGLEALSFYESYKPDIIISDIQMPKLNGLDMARKIRMKDKKTPIILATAFTQTDYLLQAVELQLIKYIVKPITSAKLKEALTLAYEHLHQETKAIIPIGDQTVYDTFNKTVIYQDTPVNLTKNELLLLDLLARNSHRAVSYEEIERYVWTDSYMSLDTLRSFIRLLRKKLPEVTLKNISGIGYRLLH